MAQNPFGHCEGLGSAIPKTELCCIGSKRRPYTILINYCGLKPGEVSVYVKPLYRNKQKQLIKL